MKENMLPYIVIAVSIFIVIIIALVVIMAVKRKRRTAAAEAPEGPETVGKGASGEGTYEGITYRYKHFRGTDKAPPYFSITIPCSTPGAFTIKRETKFDRFFKKLGVNVEIDTHDPAFDDTFYMTSDTIPFTRQFLEKSENRRSIQDLFNLGFNNLKHDGKTLTATWQNFPRRTRMETATMEKAVAQMAVPVHNLPKITTYETEEPSTWKLKRLFAFAFPILVTVTGIVALILTFTTYKPLDPGKVFVNSLQYSLPLFVLFTWFSIHLLKGRSSSHRELIAVFFICLLGFPLAGFGYNGYLNGALDDNPPAVHEVLVVNKYYSKSKNSYSYYARVESWREAETTEKLGVSKKYYNSLQPGTSVITVTTKPGKFGFEWIVGFF